MFNMYIIQAHAGNLTEWERATSVVQAARLVLVRENPTPDAQVTALAPTTHGWLTACQSPLQARMTDRSAWAATVAVSCATPRWTIYVPFTFTLWRPVVLAADFLRAGAVIKHQDLTVRRELISAETGPVCFSEGSVVGKVLNANVNTGAKIDPQNLVAPEIIHQGQQVTLEARFGNVRIRAEGIALNDGRLGSTLLVRNTESGKVVTGIVQLDGKVLLTPGKS
ncbi:Putative flagellar basal-body P-ring formation protein FlgA [Acidithiobacillus ferrivorans]|nr:Putative flagellar basal-body P-ring formation protein FlgA [Acidithiobacillus ferrivorans]